MCKFKIIDNHNSLDFSYFYQKILIDNEKDKDMFNQNRETLIIN